MSMALRSACTPSLGSRPAGVRPTAVRPVSRTLRTVGQRSAPAPSRGVATQVGVEIAQIAGEAGFIAGTAVTMVAITLVGLAFGFVLLRVEALAEEGKL